MVSCGCSPKCQIRKFWVSESFPFLPPQSPLLDCTTEMTEGEERDDSCIVCVCVVVRGGDKTKVHKEDGCGHGREGKRRTRRRQSVERVLAIRALFAVNTHSERSGHLSLLSIFLRRHSRSHPQAKTGQGLALTRYRSAFRMHALAATRKTGGEMEVFSTLSKMTDLNALCLIRIDYLSDR